MPNSIDKISTKELLPSLSNTMEKELIEQTSLNNRYKINISRSSSHVSTYKNDAAETVPNKRLYVRSSSEFTLNINILLSDLKTMLTQIKSIKNEYIQKRTSKAHKNIENRKGWVAKKTTKIEALEKKIKIKNKRLARLENQLRRYDNLLEGLQVISKKRLKEHNLNPAAIRNKATQDAEKYKKTKIQLLNQEIKIISYQDKIIELEERTRKDKEKIKRVERKASEKYDPQIKIYETLITKYASPKAIRNA